jgi:hypothetical protein
MKFRIASESPPNFGDLEPYLQVVEDDSEICSLTGWDLYDVTVLASAPPGTVEKVVQAIERQPNCIETCKLKNWLPTTEEDPRPSLSQMEIPDRVKLERLWGN